jgi:hypothetical protein
MFETKAVLRTNTAAPEAPDKPVLSSRTRTALKVRWVAPDRCGEEISAYELHMCRASAAEEGVFREEGEWELAFEASPKETSWKASKLSPGQVYGFRVRAVNSKGPGAFSAHAYYSTAGDGAVARDVNARGESL